MKCELKVILTLIFSLSLAYLVSASEMIFSTQFKSNDDWEANDDRRYTTFTTWSGNFNGSLLDANRDPVGPIGDFIVLQRAGMPRNSDVQYGLWAGLPSDDMGPGDSTTKLSILNT